MGHRGVALNFCPSDPGQISLPHQMRQPVVHAFIQIAHPVRFTQLAELLAEGLEAIVEGAWVVGVGAEKSL